MHLRGFDNFHIKESRREDDTHEVLKYFMSILRECSIELQNFGTHGDEQKEIRAIITIPTDLQTTNEFIQEILERYKNPEINNDEYSRKLDQDLKIVKLIESESNYRMSKEFSHVDWSPIKSHFPLKKNIKSKDIDKLHVYFYMVRKSKSKLY